MLNSLPDGHLVHNHDLAWGLAALASGNVAGFLGLDTDEQAFFMAVVQAKNEIAAVQAWDQERRARRRGK